MTAYPVGPHAATRYLDALADTLAAAIRAASRGAYALKPPGILSPARTLEDHTQWLPNRCPRA